MCVKDQNKISKFKPHKRACSHRKKKKSWKRKPSIGKVEEVYDSCPSNDIKIVLGDWNAKVRREEIYQGLIGKNSMHLTTNNNGQRLVDLAAAKNMVVFSTYFPHKEIRKKTWRSSDGKTNNQINHLLIDKRNASCMLDVKSHRGASGDSDHYLVRGKCRCKIAYNKYKPNRTTRRFHINALQDVSTVRRF